MSGRLIAIRKYPSSLSWEFLSCSGSGNQCFGYYYCAEKSQVLLSMTKSLPYSADNHETMAGHLLAQT